MEALKRPLFMEYKENQPFNENYLRSCPLLDNYGKLAEMVENSNANSTEMLNPEDVNNLCNKCKQVATDWEVAADEIWEKTQKKNRRNGI